MGSESESGFEFTEFHRLPFQADHEESVLEEWLESHPDAILEDGKILIIGPSGPNGSRCINRPARGRPFRTRGRGRVEARPHTPGRCSAGA